MQRISKHMTGYVLFQVLFALQKMGVFDALKRNPTGMTAASLATELSLDAKFLEATCDFVSINAPELLHCSEERYVLNPYFWDSQVQNNLNFTLAYEPIFSALPLLLSGQSLYGTDVVRDGQYLGISSSLYNKKASDVIRTMIQRAGVDTVVDLGCGTGEFLESLLEETPHVRCFGVEVDAGAARVARERLGISKYSHAQVIVGDVARPHDWKDELFKEGDLGKIAFVGMTVWHEFLYEGERTLIDIFAQYRTLFPKSLFVVAEFNGLTRKELSALPDALRETSSVYQLVHPLTLQGMPQPVERWQKYFEQSGIRVEESISVYPNTTVYVGKL